MLKIIRDKWDRNKDKLQETLIKGSTFINECSYIDLVKLSFQIIFNSDGEGDQLDIKKITEIDDGDYQGTLLYLIPFETYQPSEYEYLMTHVSYGSCSGCDTLQSIQDQDYGKIFLTDQQVSDFMTLCKDILTNTIKPYNSGWRENPDYEQLN
jgi:hypothetical protein